MEDQETYPLPEDPALASVAAALRDAGHWGEIVDRDWRWVYMTDDLRLSHGGLLQLVPVPLGAHYFGTEAVSARLKWPTGSNRVEFVRESFEQIGGWALADTTEGREQLSGLVDGALVDIVEGLSPIDTESARTVVWHGMHSGGTILAYMTAVRVHDGGGRLAGTALIYKPGASMAVLGTVAGAGDLRHFKRMEQVAKAGRRPAAILFADLESSSLLSRTLSTASYFALGRRMARAADQCVIDAGGLVGRHVGDGVVAFFLAASTGSESAASRACIQAARALREAMVAIAARSELAPDDLVMRFGLHWGSTLYVGQITTGGRTEVTALGDEVNEGARIEACATGGRALASKALVERLDPDDAAALDLNPDRVTYTALADLPMATEKARRDAPAIAVCEV
jgi:class 3 adenylate cyclase